jgi:hypothetical protein
MFTANEATVQDHDALYARTFFNSHVTIYPVEDQDTHGI